MNAGWTRRAALLSWVAFFLLVFAMCGCGFQYPSVERKAALGVWEYRITEPNRATDGRLVIYADVYPGTETGQVCGFYRFGEVPERGYVVDVHVVVVDRGTLAVDFELLADDGSSRDKVVATFDTTSQWLIGTVGGYRFSARQASTGQGTGPKPN